MLTNDLDMLSQPDIAAIAPPDSAAQTPITTPPKTPTHTVAPPRPAGNAAVAAAVAATIVVVFYGLIAGVRMTPATPLVDPLHRYFAGHPVAIAATILFAAAIGILISKYFGVVAQRSSQSLLHDDQLAPPVADSPSPADRWRNETDAAHVAQNWLTHLASLPPSAHNSRLVTRLREVLIRRSDRGSGSAAGDDMRELSTRDGDNAHDSLGLVRIIVWAIPMLGFLGTVLGITQTLGGLDFSNGQSAVDSLKIGLNVAFDTTAVGLVLSVVAIFLQFPVERAEMELLAAIDARVGRLVSKHLPGGDAVDDQTLLIGELCRGIETAVAQSLSDQTKLWRSTIDEAQSHWTGNHQSQHDAFVKAFEVALVPSLQSHAETVRQTQQTASGAITSISSTIVSVSNQLAAATNRLDEVADAIGSRQSADARRTEATTTAVVALARAVDQLTHRLAQNVPGDATSADVSAATSVNDPADVSAASSANGSPVITRRAA